MERAKCFIKTNKNMMEIGRMVKNMEMEHINQENNNLLVNGIEGN